MTKPADTRTDPTTNDESTAGLPENTAVIAAALHSLTPDLLATLAGLSGASDELLVESLQLLGVGARLALQAIGATVARSVPGQRQDVVVPLPFCRAVMAAAAARGNYDLPVLEDLLTELEAFSEPAARQAQARPAAGQRPAAR